MTIVKKSRTVAYTCEQLFHLVSDVEHYPAFLPNCVKSDVHYRDADRVQATLVIGSGSMSKSFTTSNRLQTNKMIEIRLVAGPFNHLEGFWRFDKVEEGCKVSFDLEFEFAGGMLSSMILGPLFEQITDKMVDSFCDRAKAIYDTD